MTTAVISNCPNCNASIKSGTFSSNLLISTPQTTLINEYAETKNDGYCEKCFFAPIHTAKLKLAEEIKKVNADFQRSLPNVPVITIHSPLNWNYEVIGIVTGQTTTGTGIVAEFTSTFTDLVGGQAERYNIKLKAGENLCLNQLRTQAIEMGGNAIIATDIDYSEVGGNKGMLMVCMSGTAVNLLNVEILKASNDITSLKSLLDRLKYLNTLSAID